MSAMSAGMLIYAACIEMLAADFVMDPQLKRSSFSLQALAMFSLLMGMTGMALIASVYNSQFIEKTRLTMRFLDCNDTKFN